MCAYLIDHDPRGRLGQGGIAYIYIIYDPISLSVSYFSRSVSFIFSMTYLISRP